MIEKYGLFNHHEDNNTALILFSDEPVTDKRGDEEIKVLYHQDKVVGYEIYDFIRYAKIKYSGIIFLPSDPLIDVINFVLENHQLEKLGYKKESGYVVLTNDNKKMVFAKEGTFLRDETISKGRFCSYYDLYIERENDQELIVIDEDIKEGIDFFISEEK
ncbi:MAG: hypothetical protein K5925_06330 [Bacilli bacterium]|nr:hypothetical protein [Bacilli bacterium]